MFMTCFSQEALLRRLQFLQQEIKKIEALQAELTSGRQVERDMKGVYTVYTHRPTVITL